MCVSGRLLQGSGCGGGSVLILAMLLTRTCGIRIVPVGELKPNVKNLCKVALCSSYEVCVLDVAGEANSGDIMSLTLAPRTFASIYPSSPADSYDPQFLPLSLHALQI